MWIIKDEALRKMLGGEYCQVVVAKQTNPSISLRKLFNFQFNFFSYNGFRKFFNSKLKDIIDKMKFIDDDSILGKFIRFICRL